MINARTHITTCRQPIPELVFFTVIISSVDEKAMDGVRYRTIKILYDYFLSTVSQDIATTTKEYHSMGRRSFVVRTSLTVNLTLDLQSLYTYE